MFGGFWLLRAVGRNAANGVKSDLTKEQVKPTKVPPLVPVVIIVTGIFVVIANVRDHAVPGWVTPAALLLGLLVLGGVFWSGASDEYRAQRNLKDLPNPEDELHRKHTAIQFRAQASKYDADIIDVETTGVEPAAPVFMTYRQIKAQEEETERLQRVAAILVHPCDYCGAQANLPCNREVDGEVMVLLDRERGLVAHAHRIGGAIAAGTAKVTDVVAQFEGNVPDQVWETAL